MFVEATLHEFAARGRFDPNVDTIRAGLRVRRDAMISALAREMPEGTVWNEPEGGYFLWVDLPGGVSGEQLLAQADGAGVTFVKGADFFFDGGGESSVRLAFSYATAEEIDEGIARLGKLVHEALAVAA
jgi:2-aminoadipate transaminase